MVACASTAPNFSKPKLEWMKFGQTSRADIVTRYGPPEREVQFTRNGQVVSQLNFRYVATFGSDAEKRQLAFLLAGDRVVGYEFGDSYMDEETNFDSNKVGTVVKGVTTREQVLSLFGNPLGVLAYPATTQDETAAGDFVFLFGRPDPAWLPIGKITKAEIIERYGEPPLTEQFTRNGKVIEALSYHFGRQKFGETMTSFKHLFCYFSGDVFIGHSFRTALAEEQVNFDETKIPAIVKGKTTKAEVIALFGNPRSTYVFPLTTDKKTSEGDSAIVYHYVSPRADSTDFKRLEVTFGPDGVAKDFDYDAETRPAPKSTEPTAEVPF